MTTGWLLSDLGPSILLAGKQICSYLAFSTWQGIGIWFLVFGGIRCRVLSVAVDEGGGDDKGGSGFAEGWCCSSEGGFGGRGWYLTRCV